MDTPYYLFDTNIVKQNYDMLKNSLAVDRLFYALKPNSEDRILEVLNTNGANFEIASVGELEKLKRMNVNSERIICSLPVKSDEMIESMYRYGIRYFVFDTEYEYLKLRRLASDAKLILRIDITDIAEKTIEFGMAYENFAEALQKGTLRSEHIDGITFYISKNKDADKIIKALEYSEHFLKHLNKKSILNIGGNYRLPTEVSSDFYERLNRKLSSLKEKYGCILFAEPGRSVVKSAGKLITSVIGVKRDKKYVYIDAGIPTGISYCPNEIVNLTRQEETEPIEYSFFDITCSHRLLFKTRLPFDININDHLEFRNFGSYSICKSSNFHGWETPACYYI